MTDTLITQKVLWLVIFIDFLFHSPREKTVIKCYILRIHKLENISNLPNLVAII